ncbi:MAG: TonB family protein [Pyrinomonadaceae bacterium]
MRRILITVSLVIFILAAGQTGFGQEKRAAKKRSKPAKQPSPTFVLTMPAGKPDDGCAGDGITDPYSTVSGSNAVPPPAIKTPCTNADQPFRLLAKPRANYTDAARNNAISGTVYLRVTFLASGGVGSVLPINRLAHGLTEKAIEAAKQIRFEPQRKNGKPVTTTRMLSYTFTAY